MKRKLLKDAAERKVRNDASLLRRLWLDGKALVKAVQEKLWSQIQLGKRWVQGKIRKLHHWLWNNPGEVVATVAVVFLLFLMTGAVVGAGLYLAEQVEADRDSPEATLVVSGENCWKLQNQTVDPYQGVLVFKKGNQKVRLNQWKALEQRDIVWANAMEALGEEPDRADDCIGVAPPD